MFYHRDAEGVIPGHGQRPRQSGSKPGSARLSQLTAISLKSLSFLDLSLSGFGPICAFWFADLLDERFIAQRVAAWWRRSSRSGRPITLCPGVPQVPACTGLLRDQVQQASPSQVRLRDSPPNGPDRICSTYNIAVQNVFQPSASLQRAFLDADAPQPCGSRGHIRNEPGEPQSAPVLTTSAGPGRRQNDGIVLGDGGRAKFHLE